MRRRAQPAKLLLAGWFSLERGGATAGDVAALDVVRGWLDAAGVDYDVAVARDLALDGVDWHSVPPAAYSTLVLVCGPLSPRLAIWRLVSRFGGCRLVAVDVSLVESPEAYADFAAIVARDGGGEPRPDLSFAADLKAVPVIGVLRVHHQAEYARGRHEEVDGLIAKQLASRSVVTVPIDTRLDENTGDLRTADEVAALVGKMDAVVTTRMHGLVFALRHGIPALAIDPVAGGAKVAAQAAAVGWPHIVKADELDAEIFQRELDACLTAEARRVAASCAARAAEAVEQVRLEFLETLAEGESGES